MRLIIDSVGHFTLTDGNLIEVANQAE